MKLLKQMLGNKTNHLLVLSYGIYYLCPYFSYIPGDKRGAAGIDSSMFTHLKRNWHWSSVGNSTQPTYKKEDPNIRHMKLKSVSKSISFKDLPCHKKITAATLQVSFI